jgi:hypothetical protein
MSVGLCRWSSENFLIRRVIAGGALADSDFVHRRIGVTSTAVLTKKTSSAM